MLLWFLILAASTALVVFVAASLYVRVRRQMKHPASARSGKLTTGEITHLLRKLDRMREKEATMARLAAQPYERQTWSTELAKQAGIVVSASLFVALCARVTVPLPVTPVPLTLQNFGVLVVGLLLGSRCGFAALSVYLVEGALGLPVFNPAGPGGIAQILGPTGGFLMAYPLVAFVAGWIYERIGEHISEQSSEHSSEQSPRRFGVAVLSGLAAEVLLFAGGLSWLAVLTHSVATAFRFGLYWFAFAEVIKILMAAAVASRWQKRVSPRA